MPNLSQVELEIVQLFVFASTLDEAGNLPVLSYAQISASATTAPHELRAAFAHLVDRGWLVRAGTISGMTLHWHDQDPCVLVGDGVTLAKELATEYHLSLTEKATAALRQEIDGTQPMSMIASPM